MSKEAVFYGIGAAAALTAFFCAIPHESRGCFCATVFLSLLHPLLTSLKSLFYKALGALSAVRANLAPSDLVPQDNSSFCLRRNNRPPPSISRAVHRGVWSGRRRQRNASRHISHLRVDNVFNLGRLQGEREGSVFFSALFLFSRLLGALWFYVPTDLSLEPVSAAASGSWGLNKAFALRLHVTLYSYPESVE